MDASKEFYAGLKGVTEPEKKRKFIGGAFIDAFEAEVYLPGMSLGFGLFTDILQVEVLKTEASSNSNKIGWFLQGTLYVGTYLELDLPPMLTVRRYPDVIESLSFKGPSQTIKTHHNVVSRSRSCDANSQTHKHYRVDFLTG